jgi:type II secretory pathway component PulF
LSEEGSSLGDALADVDLPALREVAGAGADGFSRTLSALADAALGRRRMRRRLAVAVIYPLFVLAATVAVGVFVVHHVLPLADAWHRETGARPPVASFGADELELLLGPAGGLALLTLVALFLLMWSRGGLGFRARLFAPLTASVRAGVIKGLAALLDAGQPLPESLTRVARALQADGYASRALLMVRSRVEQGGALTEALVATGLLPAAWAGPLRAAERDSVGLERALGGVGEALGLEADLSAVTQRTWLLTVATLLTGGLVLWIGLALFGGLRWSI